MSAAARVMQSLAPRRHGRPIRSETPHEQIEGSAYEAAAELVLYRDTHKARRLRADAACDEAVARMERAFEMRDAAAFRAATDDYWLNDRVEDDEAGCGDQRVHTAHQHVKAIPSAVMLIEMRADGSEVPDAILAICTRHTEALPGMARGRGKGQR